MQAKVAGPLGFEPKRGRAQELKNRAKLGKSVGIAGMILISKIFLFRRALSAQLLPIIVANPEWIKRKDTVEVH
jgi:hypothetical protein